jgi:hypothetical protein
MMDEIEIAYQKAEKLGCPSHKILATLVHMPMIFQEHHPELEGSINELFKLVRMIDASMKYMKKHGGR